MDEKDFQAALQAARNRLIACETAQCLEALDGLAAASRDQPLYLQEIAALYLQCGRHEAAADCHARSAALLPSDPQTAYNLATSELALGRLDEAEALFSRAIRLDPADYGAWLNRSLLRTQTPETHHVEQLRYLRSQMKPDDPGHVPLCYALAKELEDLGRSGESFECLQEGSVRRRQQLRYDVREDEETMAEIAAHFDRERLGRARPCEPSPRPVFVLGLPRSGTTLVERIISSHSRVESLGEHNLLAFALVAETGQAPRKSELVAASAQADFAAIGRRYLSGIAGLGTAGLSLVDKTPQNFLYLGLIHLALPGAKVIHLRRHPLDSCYAIYKTLFRAGYPYSYSLQDVGRYYIAYRRLMDHWRATIPEAFLDVDYEALVADQEGESRRLINYLELDWEDACLDFHHHRGAAATASAAQVRKPIYSSSVGLWKRYAGQLAPFAAKLREHGIEID